MKRRKKILQNISSNWVLSATRVLTSMLTIPFIISHVGMEEYGVWILVTQILLYITILNNGLGLAVTRLAAYHREDVSQVNRFVSSSFWLQLPFAVIAFLFGYVVSYLISDVFPSIQSESVRDARMVCILVGLTLGFKFVQSSYAGALKGFQLYTYFNLATASGVLLRAAFTVGLLWIWPSIIALQMAVVAASLFEMLFLAFWAYRSIPGISVAFLHVDRATVKELFDHAKHAIARTLGEVLMFGAMPVLIGWWGDMTDVAIYNLACKIPRHVRRLVQGAQTVFLPVLTSLFAKKNVQQMQLMLVKGTRLTAILTMFFCIPTFVFADSILAIWLRREVPDSAALIMRIMLVPVVCGGIFDIWIAALVARGILRPLTLAALGTMSVAIGSVVLCHLCFDLPVAVYPAIGLCFAISMKSAVWLPTYSLRKLNVNAGAYFRNALLQPMLASAVALPIIELFCNLSHQAGSLRFVMEFTVAALIMFACLAGIAARTEAAEFLVAIRKRIPFISTPQ